jgi:cysteinyl-tRNA synthetase
MQNDLNTSEAIAKLFEVAGRVGREISTRPEATGEFASLAEAIEEVMTIFGFDLAQELSTGVEGVHIRYSEEPGEEVLERVATRERARLEKDWATADRLREELHADGWAVEDTPEGPILIRR